MIADVGLATLLCDTYDAETARLEIHFWYPAGVDREYYRINWVAPGRNLMLGFHQDADHPDPGRCHIQLNQEEVAVDRHGTAFLYTHPLAVFDDRLQQFPAALGTIHWENGTPSLLTWSV